ncbi:hypothetical protein [Nonomuraea sp. NPDC049709]|uniref:hypothetical protein n=1 Tax=Nonomuraea sp. NPDC049709 TaxID=3154736 RepID=UPI00344A1AE7
MPLTAQAYADEQRAQGVPGERVQLSADLYAYVRSGGLASLTGDVRTVLGRPARDFTDCARATAAQGTWDF